MQLVDRQRYQVPLKSARTLSTRARGGTGLRQRLPGHRPRGLYLNRPPHTSIYTPCMSSRRAGSTYRGVSPGELIRDLAGWNKTVQIEPHPATSNLAQLGKGFKMNHVQQHDDVREDTCSCLEKCPKTSLYPEKLVVRQSTFYLFSIVINLQVLQYSHAIGPGSLFSKSHFGLKRDRGAFAKLGSHNS